MTTIRLARLPDDKPVLLSFIDGLQAFEYEIVPDRRLDATLAQEHFAKLERDIAARDGAMLVAEGADGVIAGWAVVVEAEDELYIVPELKRFAYVAELYLAEAARGHGLGRDLLAACEGWAKARGIATLAIGVLAGNTRARAVYEQAGFAPYAMTLRKTI